MHVRGTLLLLAALIAAPVALAQNTAPKPVPAQVGDAPASAEPVQRDYRFEVASIRQTVQTPGNGPHFDPGLYRVEAMPLLSVVVEALGIKHGYQIECPSWINTEFFTINATPPEGATKDDVPIMLLHLLEDRFGLKYHHEARRMSGYELVVVKPGLGLIKSAGPAPQTPTAGPWFEVGKDGTRHISKNAGSSELWTGSNAGMKVEWRVRNESMEKIAGRVADKVSAPVMDATGLEGAYDFTLIYSPELGGPGSAAGEASVPMEHPLLRDALLEQLGLAIKPIKNVSVDVIVIDELKKEPTEN